MVEVREGTNNPIRVTSRWVVGGDFLLKPTAVASRSAPTPGSEEVLAHPALRIRGAATKLAGSASQEKTRSGAAPIVRSTWIVTMRLPVVCMHLRGMLGLAPPPGGRSP